MRRIPALVGLLFILSTAIAQPIDGVRPSAQPVVHVEEGDWGNAGRRDIETVLTSVVDVLLPYFPQHAAVRVSVAYSRQGPIVLLGRSEKGFHRVLLDVQDARWDQFAYQFAHELCHVFTNYEHREIAPGVVARDHQWFEETVCEATSLFALNRMAARWQDSPPHPEWRSYAPAFREYAQRRLADARRRLPAGETVARWLSSNQDALEHDPYLRDRNEVVAAQLLPLIESAPDAFAAIGYLNTAGISPTLSAYLASWYECCPRQHRGFVAQVIALLEGHDPTHRPLVL